MPSQTESQRQKWQTSKARSRWAESLLRRAENQISIESDAVAKIQTAINAAQTEVAAILVDIQANQAPEWRVRRAQQQVAALERLDGELRSKLLNIARAASEEVKILSKGMPQQEVDRIDKEVGRAISKLTGSTRSARPEIGRSAGQDRGLVAIDARSVDIATSFVPALIADQAGTLKKAVQSEIVRNSLALTTPAESMARLTSVATPIGAFPTAAVRAEAIVRTEFGRVSNIAAMSAIQSLAANPYGLSAEQRSYMLGADGTMYKEWIAVGDHRTRPEHAALDGTIIPINESFMVGEFPAQFPKDPSLPAKHAVNCRCMVVPSFPPEIADRLGAMPDAGDGSFGDMLAMMQEGGMVGTGSAGGGEAFSYPPENPPNGFDYDIGYDPSDAMMNTFFVEQGGTTPALSSATDQTAPQQPITVVRSVSPLTIIAGIQQQFNLSGTVRTTNRPSSLLAFVQFASRILNTVERKALLKPVASRATHDPRISVDAEEFQVWLAQERGEVGRKKPLKNKKKVLIDNDEVKTVELPTPLLVATAESIAKLSADELAFFVGSSPSDRSIQKRFWEMVLETDQGAFGVDANNTLKIGYGRGAELTFDPKKWLALPQPVRATIIRGLLMSETVFVGKQAANFVTSIVDDLGNTVELRQSELKEKGSWNKSSGLLKDMLELINADAQATGIGRTPSDQTITLRIGTPDEGQGSGYTTINPIPRELYGTEFEGFARYVALEDLTLRVADLHKQVILKIKAPTDPAEREQYFKDMKADGTISMSKVDIAAGTLSLGVSGYDFVMNYLVKERSMINDPSGMSTSEAVLGDIFTLPTVGSVSATGSTLDNDVWYANSDGQLVFDLNKFISFGGSGDQAREFILAHNRATGESIVTAGRKQEIFDLADAGGRKIFQMHDLVDPPSPQVILPADGKIVGVENIFNFLHNKTGVYDTGLLKTHYAIGGWRLAMERPVPILVLPEAINSREIAVPFLSHLEKLLAYQVKMGTSGVSRDNLMPFKKKFGSYEPRDNFFLNLMAELIEKGSVSVPNAQSEDALTQWETPPASIVDVEAALPELILIANKKRRGEELTDEEKATYENATTRLGNLRDGLDLVVDWATGFYDQDNSQGTAIEVVALRKKLTSLGLDLNEDFALWRAAKLQDTVFGELTNKIIEAYKGRVPRSLLLRRMFGIRGLAGGGVKHSETGGWNRQLDPFDENGGADALDLMQFAEERGVTSEQILGEQRVAMLRKLYEADLLELQPSTRSSLNGLRDGLGSGAVTISLETSGVPVSFARKVKILVPARLGEEGVTYDQLKKVSDNIEIPEAMDFYDSQAVMDDGALALEDTSLPFRAHSSLVIEGEDGFRMILRIAAGNQLLGLANTGLFKSVTFQSQSTTTEPRGSRGQLAVTQGATSSDLPKLGVLSMAAELARAAKKTALSLADSIARDALNDPLQFEDVLRAVARAAVERGASPDDPLIAAFLALPRLQDAAEISSPQMWDDPREFGYRTLRMKRNPELAGNPHYAKATTNLAGSRRSSPMDMVDMGAIAEALFPSPQQPLQATPEVMAEYYVANRKAQEARNDWINRIRRDDTFILRAILSRAYTKEQQRALMGTLAPHEGQLLIREQAWDSKPVDVSWYELEATLLEIIADEGAKHMPAGRSDGTLVSEDAFGTVKMTPELWEATQLLDSYGWDAAKGGDEALAAYDLILAAARNNAEQRQEIIKARITPLVEALGYQRGTPEFENLLDVFVTHAQIELNRQSTILGNGESRDYFLPAGLAALNSKLVKFGKRGLSDIVADGAGMAATARFRRYARLKSPDADYDEKSPLTPQKLRLVAKALRDHVVNLQLELKSLSRKQIIDALNENNAALLGGRIKAAEWQAKARKLIRQKRSEVEAERRRLQQAARGKPAVPVSDALYEKTLEALDKDLEAAIKTISKTKFLEVTDSAVQREIEQYRERIDDLMKGVEKTIMGVTTVELGAPDTAKSLGSSSINEPWKGKWKGHPFIIKSVETMYKKSIRQEFGDFKYADLWAEPAAQIIDELGGLFIRKAQAYRRDLPDIKAPDGSILSENEALVMDWLTGYGKSHHGRKSGQEAANADLMGLFDALIGNLDRHGGNFLVAPIATARQPLFDDDGDPIDPVTKQKTGEKWDSYNIVPIDNGLAFPDPEVHLDDGWANLSPFMPPVRGEALTPRSRETLLRLWSNRSELYLRLTSVMGASRTRGFFYRLIWMLRSNELMDRETFGNAAYNPMSSNADEIIRGAFEDGQSLLDALVTPVGSPTAVRQDPNRIEGQIPALPLSDEP